MFSMFDNIVTNGQKTCVDSSFFTQNIINQPIKDQVAYVAEHYLDQLYKFVRYSFSLPKDTSEDIVHEFFLQLPNKLSKFKSDGNIEAYLFCIVRNFAIDWLRKQKTDQSHISDISPEEDFVSQIQINQTDNLPANIEKIYIDSLLKVALQKLSHKNRELIVLFYLENKSYDEISSILWIKKSGVWTMLSRAKKELENIVWQDKLLQNAVTFDI